MKKPSYLALVGTALLLATSLTPAMAAQTDITIGMVLEPPNLDPTAGAAAAIDEVVYSNVFEGLTRFNSSGEVIPGLARTWDISEDGLTYVFHLVSGATFHDGTSFDAEDVKFSLDRARGEDSTNAKKNIFEGIESVEVVDAATVRITLSAPDGLFLWQMAKGDSVIVAPETAGDNATNPVGTGPFSFVDWVQGDNIELAKYDGYWGNEVALDSVTFKFIADPTAAFAAMMAQDVDAFPNFPAPETLAQLDADPRFSVVVGATEGETILSTNNTNPPLDDVRVREAIAHAIDRQAIIDGAMFGYGTPIGTHFNPSNPNYLDLTEQSNYDPAKSIALLAEAGVTDLVLQFKLPPPSYARRGGEIIAAQLRAVGIETEITNVEWAQWLDDVYKQKNYDLTIVSHTEPFDIGIYVRDNYYFNYTSEAMAAIMTELAGTTDTAARTVLIHAAQQQIADDYVNGYLFQLAKTGVANSKINGLWENSPTQANDMTGVSWSD